jgi:hypothetical protein
VGVVLLGALTAATARLALPRVLTRRESTGNQLTLIMAALLGAVSGALVVSLAVGWSTTGTSSRSLRRVPSEATAPFHPDGTLDQTSKRNDITDYRPWSEPCFTLLGMLDPPDRPGVALLKTRGVTSSTRGAHYAA